MLRANTRPTFINDITEEERMVMQEHFTYWKGQFDKGVVAMYGAVLDPKGVFSVAAVDVQDEESMKTIVNDPAVTGEVRKDEFFPMYPAMVRK